MNLWPAPPDLARVRVIVAEDDAEMRGLVADVLREDGFLVEEVTDGGRLLVRIATEYQTGADVPSFDLLVSDIRMPVCSGLAILESLRRARWRTPVILMTAYGDDELRTRARSLAAVVLDKPFDAEDLRLAVRKLLSME